MENKETVVSIKANKVETKDGKKFMAYKCNVNGKSVDLRFKQDSADIKVIPEGYSKIVVTNLSESTSSFYPRYYATFVRLLDRVTTAVYGDDEENPFN